MFRPGDEETYNDYFNEDPQEEQPKPAPEPESEQAREEREINEVIIERRKINKYKIGFYALAAILLLAAGGWLYFFFFVPSEAGMVGGRVVEMKLEGSALSEFHGVIFENIYVDNNTLCFYGDPFEFTVSKDSIAYDLMRAKQASKRAVVYYRKYRGSIPLRGKCVVDSIISLEPLGRVVLEPQQ